MSLPAVTTRVSTLFFLGGGGHSLSGMLKVIPNQHGSLGGAYVGYGPWVEHIRGGVVWRACLHLNWDWEVITLALGIWGWKRYKWSVVAVVPVLLFTMICNLYHCSHILPILREGHSKLLGDTVLWNWRCATVCQPCLLTGIECGHKSSDPRGNQRGVLGKTLAHFVLLSPPVIMV